MASDYTDLTAIADALKYVYGETLRDQFYDEMISFNTLTKAEGAKYSLRGKGFVGGARVARSAGYGGRKESELLPPPLVGKYDQYLISPTYQYGRLRLTGPAIEAGKGDAAAFVDTLDDNIQDAYKSIKWDFERQFHGDGFGLLATTSAAATPSTTAAWNVTVTSTVGTQYIRPGMVVDFFQSTAIDQTCVGQRVSRVDPVNNKIYFEASGTDYHVSYHPIAAARSYTNGTGSVASGSYIVPMGAREATHATSNVAREMTGIEGIYDDGTAIATFENIAVSGNEWWKANILSNSSTPRELSEDLMLQAYNMSWRLGGMKPNLIRMGLGQQRKYIQLYNADIRFQPQTIKGGWKTMTFAAGDGDCKILVDPLTRPGKIYFEPDGVVQKFIQKDLDWMRLDQLMHWVSGYDEWDLVLAFYGNMGCEQRNCLTKITDLTEPPLFS